MTWPAGAGIGGSREAKTLASLQRITDAALAYLPEEELLQELLDRISELLDVDTVAILLVDGDTLLARAAKGIEEEVEQGVRIPIGRGFAGRIAAERRAVFVPDVDHADILNPILRERGIRSLLGVPIVAEGMAIGVLHVGSLTPRTFSDDERDLLQAAADRAALAIEHTRMYHQERRARQAAERVTQRMGALQRITDAALSYLPEQELLEALLLRVSELLAVDTVAILLVDGDTLLARAAKGIEEEVEQGVRIPIGRGFAGRIAAERRAVFVPDVDHADILNPILRERGIRSLLGVPLVVEGIVIGVLHVGSLTPRTFTADERDLLQAAADRAALAIERARLYEQRRVAEVLQRRLLPAELPVLAGLEAGARYLPAAGSRLGGDWYDVFPLAGGRLGVVVGDVVGHGLESAAGMAQLRTALRAYAADGRTPADAVERVNFLMWHLGPLMMTTLAYLVIDPGREAIVAVNAGHPPPLVIDPSGEARFLEAPPGVALGATPAARYDAGESPFPAGSMVLLYTDGLVERRGEPLDTGLERLRSLAAGAPGAAALCALLADRLVADAPADDVAFIAVRVEPLGDRLRRTWPASTARLAEVRQLLRRWLRGLGASDDEIFDITVACQEACTNAIEHAYAPGPAGFALDASHDGGRVRLAIRDRGRWREPRGENRGRGLPLMRQLMEAVEIRDTGDGTEVVMERMLGGAA